MCQVTSSPSAKALATAKVAANELTLSTWIKNLYRPDNIANIQKKTAAAFFGNPNHFRIFRIIEQNGGIASVEKMAIDEAMQTTLPRNLVPKKKANALPAFARQQRLGHDKSAFDKRTEAEKKALPTPKEWNEASMCDKTEGMRKLGYCFAEPFINTVFGPEYSSKWANVDHGTGKEIKTVKDFIEFVNQWDPVNSPVSEALLRQMISWAEFGIWGKTGSWAVPGERQIMAVLDVKYGHKLSVGGETYARDCKGGFFRELILKMKQIMFAPLKPIVETKLHEKYYQRDMCKQQRAGKQMPEGLTDAQQKEWKLHSEWLPNFHQVVDPAFSFSSWVRYTQHHPLYKDPIPRFVEAESSAPQASGPTVGDVKALLATLEGGDQASLASVLGKRASSCPVSVALLAGVEVGKGRPAKIAKRTATREANAAAGTDVFVPRPDAPVTTDMAPKTTATATPSPTMDIDVVTKAAMGDMEAGAKLVEAALGEDEAGAELAASPLFTPSKLEKDSACNAGCLSCHANCGVHKKYAPFCQKYYTENWVVAHSGHDGGAYPTSCKGCGACFLKPDLAEKLAKDNNKPVPTNFYTVDYKINANVMACPFAMDGKRPCEEAYCVPCHQALVDKDKSNWSARRVRAARAEAARLEAQEKEAKKKQQKKAAAAKKAANKATTGGGAGKPKKTKKAKSKTSKKNTKTTKAPAVTPKPVARRLDEELQDAAPATTGEINNTVTELEMGVL